MQIGVYTFVENTPDPATKQMLSPAQRLRDLIEEVELADQVGLEVFGIGEHHRPDFLGSAPPMLLAAAAARTKTIRLSSAVTVLSSDDPVRVYQQYSTLDLLSGGRAEIMAGRGSFIESFPLFGYDLNDYDSLFAEKLELLVKIRDSERVTWSGEHRAPLQNQAVYPRTPNKIRSGSRSAAIRRRRSAPVRSACRWRSPSSAACRSASGRSSTCSARPRRRPGTTPSKLPVGINTHGYVADTSQQAADEFFPSYAAQMTHIGRERGWPPTTRAQFDAGRPLRAHLAVGSPAGGDRENPVPARGARPPALSDADERRHHAARADHAVDRAVRNEGRARGAQGAKKSSLGRLNENGSSSSPGRGPGIHVKTIGFFGQRPAMTILNAEKN